ncbi:MAG: hypothetical protein LKK12_04530 [Bacteroidales bacterium]|jgi:hypothetical protein|nr:hypothetical protein [Bacteroidales bacterium]MCI2133631.1 hypothetical protein [Bacteroidales bacterium]
MRKGPVFISGFFLGIICTALVLFFIGREASSTVNPETGVSYPQGVTLSDHPIEFTESFDFKVLQVLDKGALALCRSRDGDPQLGVSPSYLGTTIFIVSDGQNMFYDKQIIAVPEGKNAYQIGTYQYMAQSETMKTVPVIEFM